MYSNAKANALVRDLADRLSKRLANGAGINQVVQSAYTDGNGAVWPLLTFSRNGNVAAGQPVIALEISCVDMISKDVFGGQTYAYAPHVLQLGYELDVNGKPTPAAGDLATIAAEAVQTGVRYEQKEIAHNTAVTGTSMNAAAAAADVDDLYWPTKKV